jgi:ribosomal protein S18 acetylase RimI-like enzyme
MVDLGVADNHWKSGDCVDYRLLQKKIYAPNENRDVLERMMPAGIVFRAAVPGDAYALAELSIVAGDGMYEFLLEEMAPREMLAGLMARSMKDDTAGFGWRHCFVADDKGVVGMINAYPAAWLREEEQDNLPLDRVRILDPIDQAQDWESFLINGIAVRPQHRRLGVGRRLMEWAMEQAKAGGFSRISANVWADNLAARALFESQGFRLQTAIEVPEQVGFSHVGGSLLYVAAAAYVRVI